MQVVIPRVNFEVNSQETAQLRLGIAAERRTQRSTVLESGWWVALVGGCCGPLLPHLWRASALHRPLTHSLLQLSHSTSQPRSSLTSRSPPVPAADFPRHVRRQRQHRRGPHRRSARQCGASSSGILLQQREPAIGCLPQFSDGCSELCASECNHECKLIVHMLTMAYYTV